MYFTSFINKTKKNFLVVEIFDEWLCHYTSIWNNRFWYV